MIKKDVKLGKHVQIFHPDQVNIYGCTIGDNTKVGSFVEIKNDVVIGKNCKIQAHAFIPEGVTIEDGVFIGPGVIFTNDKYPKAINSDGSLKKTKDWTITKTLVKTGAAIGAGAVILPGVIIGSHATVGAGSVVVKNVPNGKTVIGNPAKVIMRNKKKT
jgi:UDP-2-acetamido-3-amino-2,3-dideoxy-glucuronate N-acetyltransferase